jgi:hypothetical protein
MTEKEPVWVSFDMTPEQICKCQLLNITIFKAGKSHFDAPAIVGKYVVGAYPLHIRPISPPNFRCNLVAVDTIEEAIQMAVDPSKFGGYWAK